MKLTVGSHPDLPFPFSNGPEDPPDPPKGLAEPLRLATERHEQGLLDLAALVSHWIGRSRFTFNQLVAICAWGIGEEMMDKTVLHRIKRGSHARGPSIKHLDALAAGNRAIWLWQTSGERGAWAELGPHSSWGVKSEWLDGAIWLPKADAADQPLDFADFAEVLAGYGDLPYLTTTSLSQAGARKLSQALPDLLNALAIDRAWEPREAIGHLLAAYPVTDPARQRRLKQVLYDGALLSREEMEGELHALAEMIRQLRELRQYGPADLQRELTTGIRPPA